MLQHVVALHWNDQTPPNYGDVVTPVLQEMVKHIPSIRSYRCGADLGVSVATNADYLIVAEFDDVAGWREYDENTLHNEIRAKYFAPYVGSRSAAQITF